MPVRPQIATLVVAVMLLAACPEAFSQARRGGCCLPNGTCQVRLKDRCLMALGHFRGRGTTCSPTACDRVGACVLTNTVCAIRTSNACRVAGGTYRGNDTTCRPPRSNNGSEGAGDGDYDGDGDFDDDDVLGFTYRWRYPPPECR